MNNLPLVTILINNYNYARFLGEAIDSALGQSYPHKEVVVVDDGSTDNSRQVIASYGERIIPVFKENGGQASAFNVGFTKSSGEIIVFLDADDYLFPNTVERVVAAWIPGIVKVQYRLQKIDHERNPIGFCPSLDLPMESGDVLPTLLRKGRYISPVTSGNSFSRAVLEKILPVPETEFRLCADAYLIFLAPFYGEIVSLEEILGVYRIHGTNFWYLNNDNSINSVFRKIVQQDIQDYDLVVKKAQEFNYKVSELAFQDYIHLRYRLACLRLDPKNHPVPSDSTLNLVFWGIQAVWQESTLSWKRINYSIWFLCVGLLPLPIAKLAIARMNQQTGIRPLNWIFQKLNLKTVNQPL
jgi:glycosyltransferase involved in cell wall biosynthesis